MSNDPYLQMAQRVIKEYAEHPYPFLEEVEHDGCACGFYHTSMSVEGCVKNLKFSKSNCEAIVDDLVYGKNGEIAKEFSKEFADEVAGKALKARVKWLGDNVTTSWYRPDYDASTRTDMLEELGGHDLAAKAIGSYGADAEPAIPALEQLLNTFYKSETDHEARDYYRVYLPAAFALASIGKASIPALTRLSENHPHSAAKFHAASALAKLRPTDEAVVLKFLGQSWDNYNEVSPLIGTQIIPTLTAIAKSIRENTIRGQAIRILGKFGYENQGIAKTLVELTHDKEPDIRRAAVRAINGIPRNTWEPIFAVTERLTDESAAVRIEAIDAIRYFGPAAWHATPDLVSLANDKEINSSAIINALSDIGPLGALWSVPYLTNTLFDKSDRKANEAFWALRTIGPAARLGCNEFAHVPASAKDDPFKSPEFFEEVRAILRHRFGKNIIFIDNFAYLL